MPDLLPPDSSKRWAFERTCREQLERYGYREIRTPIVESTELFARGVGTSTDIVEKQMYTFDDKKGRSLTMRPEMTASCVRSYIQHAIGKKEPVTRWFYIGPMFRYERMQAGRYRQFNQIGVEAFGVSAPTVDAEQIAMLHQVYESLGIGGLDVVVNSVGGGDDRAAYGRALLEYLTPHAASLCGDCQRRLAQNPLRVLDCKTDGNSELLKEAPSVLDHLSAASLEHFDAVRVCLDDLGVPYRVDARMVRGLDYYTATVFEIISHSNNLGAQATLVGGGRYDGLVESLGGPATPAVGFALGVERNVMCMEGEAQEYVAKPDLFIMALSDAARKRAVVLAHELRGAGHYVEIEHRAIGRKGQFKRTDKLEPRFIATLDDDALASGQVSVRDRDKNDRVVAIAELSAAIGE